MTSNMEKWKKIYYPIPADEAAEGSMLDAVKHSLKKWRGLTKKNTEMYGLEVNDGFLGTKITPYDLWIDDNSCALCAKYLHANGNCNKCPLYIVRGEVKCDDERDDESVSPYMKFINGGSPSLMIRWLRKAKEYAEKKGKKK